MTLQPILGPSGGLPWNTASDASIMLAASEFQRDVRTGDYRAQAAIQRSWAVADAAIQERTNALLAKIAAAQKAGTPVTEAWLYQVGRLDQVRAFAAAQYAQLGLVVERQVASGQQAGISAGLDATQRLIQLPLTGGPIPLDFAHLDAQREFSRMVGRLQDGSPLRDLTFSNLTVQGAESVAQALVTGVLAGEGTRDIARRMTLERNMTLARAHTIARTEILRGAREASMLTMQENARLLNGWKWSAHLDSRTCGTCIALQGTLFPVGTPMETHPNCRCAPVPVTKSWDDLGYPGVKDTTINLPTGDDWLDHMNRTDMRRAFGPTRAELIRGGYVKAADLTRTLDQGRWGNQPALARVTDLKALAVTRGWTPPTGGLAPPTAPSATGWMSPRGIDDIWKARKQVRDAFDLSLAGMTPLRVGERQRLTDYWKGIREPLKQALDLLDRVVLDGRLPSLVVGRLTGGDAANLGQYRHTMDSAVDLRVRAKTDLDTLVHEIGHFMDHMGTGANQAGQMASELGWWRRIGPTADPAIKYLADLYGPWATAVKGSAGYANLKNLMTPGAHVHIEFEDGKVYDGPTNGTLAAYAGYAMAPSELWARSWTQYVAQATQDPTMLAYINGQLARGSHQFWTWEDFGAVAKGIDTVLDGLGWRP